MICDLSKIAEIYQKQDLEYLQTTLSPPLIVNKEQKAFFLYSKREVEDE